MALGAITGAVGAVGSLIGGGGPRQPRMNRAQKQALKSQANVNNAMAKMMKQMTQMMKQAQGGMFGRPCNCQQGPMSMQGMNGCFHGGQNAGNFGNAMNNLFQPNMSMNFGMNFSTGFQPPQIGAHLSMGVNMFA